MENLEGSRAAKLLKRIPGGVEILQKDGVDVPPSIPEAPAVVVSEYETVPVEPRKTEAPVKTKLSIKEDVYVLEDPTDELELKEPSKDNFHKLRTKLKGTNKTVKEQAAELAVLRTQVQDYDSGLAVSPIVTQQAARIEELERYQQIYDFKSSAVAQERFLKPLNQEREKLNRIATEYGVDVEALFSVSSIKDITTRNQALRNLFHDDLAVLEAKDTIKNISKLEQEYVVAEKEPKKHLVENDRILHERMSAAVENVTNVSKEAWSASLYHLREDLRFPEITYREGDSEHNEQFVRPILTRAGQEYGKLVKAIVESGGVNLSKDVLTAISRMTQLAHQAAAIAVDRDNLRGKLAELQESVDRKNRINRPAMSPSAAAVSANGTAKGTRQEAGYRALSRVNGVR